MSSSSSVVLTLSLPAFPEGFEALKITILSVFASEIEAEIKIRAPVDYGYLRSHWTVDWPIVDDKISIGTNAFYAPFLTTGTGIFGPMRRPICARGLRPGNTDPTAPRALRFKYKGKIMIRRCVRGMRPRPYVEEGIEAGVNSAVAALQEMSRRGEL